MGIQFYSPARVKQLMTASVLKIEPGEPVEVAARTLTHYNIGILPVCSGDKLMGMVTDRDLVTRCMAANREPSKTTVRDVMTGQVIVIQPDMDVGVAAHLMGRKQVRRLPVVENGKLCGMLSLGDMATREESAMDAADALSDIAENVR